MSEPPRDPEQLGASAEAVRAEIAADAAVGAVHLVVADLARSLAYYAEAVGLAVIEREAGCARVGVGDRALVVLEEQRGARRGTGYTGLYHFALLVPERVDLARWLAHAARRRVPLAGMADHFVSEALYLTDPDGHGIEIYWDRPREIWEGQVAERMTTEPLDTADLLGELDDPAREPFEALAPGTVMGHVHLKVAGIAATVAFYRDVLGLGLMARLGGRAAFFGAGGYHHHIGANTWESAGAAAPPADVARLQHLTIVLPNTAARDAVRARVEASGVVTRDTERGPLCEDPSGNPIVLAVADPVAGAA
ncbi:MAG TPA: VOC family protein [Solirubrobacteraceae bacterium]|nr:VOC family protein [Solirubrobacteraceae bacterium]